MKRPLRSFFIHLLAIWLISKYLGGIDYGNNPQFLALGALALTAADMLLKPLLNLLLFPFNLVTLGFFRWISNVVTLYIATTLVRIGRAHSELQSQFHLVCRLLLEKNK